MVVRPMVRERARTYARSMTTASPQDVAPATEAELSESEAAEIEERLRGLGYID